MNKTVGVPDQLRDAKAQLLEGEVPRKVPMREFLKWFHVDRRTGWVNNYIGAVLRDLQLRTEPDFDIVNLDVSIAIKLDTNNTDGSINPTLVAVKESTVETVENVQKPRRAGNDPTLRIRVLPSADRYPEVIAPDASIAAAIHIMVSKEFSQLPVVVNRSVKGAVSWRSLGQALAFGTKVERVGECIEAALEMRASTSLMSAIEAISKSDYALINDDSGRLIGLVTTADLSVAFGNLSEPFLLLREVENYIRAILEVRFSDRELIEFRDPNIRRPVSTAADLSLGEYLTALSKESIWKKLAVNADRKQFVKSLDVVRSVRNEVMHFDPDPISPDRLEQVNEFLRLLRAIGKSMIGSSS